LGGGGVVVVVVVVVSVVPVLPRVLPAQQGGQVLLGTVENPEPHDCAKELAAPDVDRRGLGGELVVCAPVSTYNSVGIK